MGKMVGGGVESVVMNFFRAIDHDEFRFDFLVDSDSTHVPENEIHALGGRVIYTPPYQKLIPYRRCLRDIFQGGGYDAVHSHINALSVIPLGVAKECGVGVRIAHSHSASGKGEPLRNAVKWFLRLGANIYPTHRLACSEHSGEWLFGRGAKFQVLHNALPIESFEFDEEARESIRDDLGIRNGAFVVGHIGRMCKTKNQLFLLDVISEVRSRGVEISLILVGDGPSEEAVRQRVRDLDLDDCVYLLGQREDVNRVYSSFDLFVLPSLYEGLGMVAIEAQINGLPCIVSDQVPQEALIAPGCTKLPLASVRDWADAVVESSRVPHRTIPDLATFSDYDISVEVHRLEEFYRSAVHR
ncbi:glycosyltransferase family 1 protein [Thermophilibacter sp.]